MSIAFVALGSNMGDRKNYIKIAIDALGNKGVTILKESRIYETEPYGYEQQDKFLNGVIKIETQMTPNELLNTLLEIENDIGRIRTIKWGPRVVDLDMIFYENQIVDEVNLRIPHPDMHNREFVLKPICDIEPNFEHPIFKKTMLKLYEELISYK
jgi:dihydroneopterin aldolase/2-amino-4-hydroxy-6-hydroxymethyldihydropteridine diphosphokinase